VPEYSFLDARGLGAFEGKSLDTLPEVLVSVHYIMNKLSLQLRVTRIYGSTRAVSLIGITFLITIQLGYSMFSGSDAGLTASS
jgi:hypothetical protein